MIREADISEKIIAIGRAGLVLHEVLSVLEGDKTAMVATFNDFQEMDRFRNSLPELTVRESADRWMGSSIVCGISLDKEAAAVAAEYLSNNVADQGILLGYPSCCSKRYEDTTLSGIWEDSAASVYGSRERSSSFNFLTNNIFNFYSRIGKSEKNFSRMKECREKSRLLPVNFMNLQFISHFPCRYDCPESINIGRRNRALLKKYAPDMEKTVSSVLVKPVLFFDIFEWIVFDGRAEKDVIHYESVVQPFSLVDEVLIEKISEGNAISADEEEINVMADDKIIFSRKKKRKEDGFILDFADTEGDLEKE